MNNKIKGGIYGLLVGDAVGVPYKSYSKEALAVLPYIDMVPAIGHKRTYQDVKVGTYSDNGALSLCLLNSLIDNEGLDLEDLMESFQSFRTQGMFAIDHIVFDINRQTALALVSYERGENLNECGKVLPLGKDNGALARMLPLALFYHDIDEIEFIKKAHYQANISHSHPINGICCSLYGLWARNVFKRVEHPFEKAVKTLEDNFSEKGISLLHHQILSHSEVKGTNHIIDSLMSAKYLLDNYTTYFDIVVQAVRLGNDTNSIACIAGGIAGIKYGYSTIPRNWIDLLRGKDTVELLLKKLELLKEYND